AMPSRLEKLIDPFRPLPDSQPPSEVWRFYAHFLREVWPVFIMLLGVGLIGSLIEVSLFGFLGRLVDMVQATPAAQRGTAFFVAHRQELLGMLVVALLLRPVF